MFKHQRCEVNIYREIITPPRCGFDLSRHTFLRRCRRLNYGRTVGAEKVTRRFSGDRSNKGYILKCNHTWKHRKIYRFFFERSKEEGEVRIRRTNGQVFVLKPENPKRSALDVAGIDLGISTKEIVEFVGEGRERL